MLKNLLVIALLSSGLIIFNACSSSDEKAATEKRSDQVKEDGSGEFAGDEDFAEEGDAGDDAGSSGDEESAKDGESDSGDVADEGDAEGDNANQEDSESDQDAGDEVAGEDGDEGDDVAEDGDEFADEDKADGEKTEKAAGDEAPQDDQVTADLGEEKPKADEPPVVEDSPIADTAPVDDAFAQEAPADSDAVEKGDAAASMGESDLGGDSFAAPAEAPKWIPLRKMSTTPFKKKGVLANRIYIAREGDDLSSVSQKIYGDDRTQELLMINPWLEKGITVGTKIYYNSPKNPSDSSQLLTYYEDLGLEPEVYYSKAGDNIRAVGTQLLGNKKSWKELWATNLDVQSKQELPEGTQLRYWASAEGSMNMATNSSPAELAPPVDAPSQMEAMPSPGDSAMTPPPPPQPSTVADAGKAGSPMNPGGASAGTSDIPPPPPMPTTAGSMDSVPPPPSPTEVAPPPPPPTQVAQRPPRRPPRKGPDANLNAQDDTMMWMALGAIVLVLLVALIIIRKKRSKEAIDFNTSTHTQIE